jgi:hypothetical protein
MGPLSLSSVARHQLRHRHSATLRVANEYAARIANKQAPCHYRITDFGALTSTIQESVVAIDTTGWAGIDPLGQKLLSS